MGRGAVSVELPAAWRPLTEAEVADAFPHRSVTAETLVAAASREGRFLVLVAADRKPSLVDFARREGLARLKAALDAYLPGVIQAFRPLDAVEGELAGQPALSYRFTGLASGAPTRQVRRFAMELVVVPAETALYTVSLLDLSGATRFTDPSLLALKAALRVLFESGGPSDAPAPCATGQQVRPMGSGESLASPPPCGSAAMPSPPPPVLRCGAGDPSDAPPPGCSRDRALPPAGGGEPASPASLTRPAAAVGGETGSPGSPTRPAAAEAPSQQAPESAP